MLWFGADPGGKESFGIAVLRDDGSFDTTIVSCADEAIGWLKQEPTAAGIDAPLWWSSGRSGDRKADQFLRQQYKISAGTVQPANCLRGAALVQGVMLLHLLCERFPGLSVTETHPKALLKALKISRVKVADHFGVRSDMPQTEHEHDALLGAIAAREGYLKRWTYNLAAHRFSSEQDPTKCASSPIAYWWPEP